MLADVSMTGCKIASRYPPVVGSKITLFLDLQDGQPALCLPGTTVCRVMGEVFGVKFSTMTCKWIKWSASIPLVLLFGAAGFLVLAQVAVAQDNAPAVLLDLYLATWSYILAVAGVALLTGWWLWRSIHMRTAHALRPC